MFEVLENLSRFHREHEKYYSEAPLHQAAALQRASRTLVALAERWSEPREQPHPTGSPFAGAQDLNDGRAIEAGGVLFMESGDEPAEIARIKGDLESMSAGAEEIGTWLASAMEASWQTAEGLLGLAALADLLGERHRIIANDWQSASTLLLVARELRRANAILDRVDFSVEALRADLAGPATAPDLLFSAAEMMDHAADLVAASAVLVHQNQRRWRVFNRRVRELMSAEPPMS